MQEKKKIAMIGLGYIGLPTAAMMASRGYEVVGVDVSKDVVDTVNKGEIHIVEPGLEELVSSVVKLGYLRATTEIEPSDVFVVAVPTPFKDNFEPELKYIQSAIRSISNVLKKGDLVILESTSPVGTTEIVARWLAEFRPDLSFPQQVGEDTDISVAYCPERVLPGKILEELIANDRMVGGMTKACTQKAIEFYKGFVKGDCLPTNARTAEMGKLTENSFRDVNIAFANELSLICDELGINVWEVITLANHHPRVDILQPGPGVGGHCIAVDPWFIVNSAPKQAKLIKMAREINDGKPLYVVEKVRASARLFTKPTIACMGLSFKANVDDLRSSPALKIAKMICVEQLGKVVLVEPNIKSIPSDFDGMDNVMMMDSVSEAVKIANIVVGLVDHEDFGKIKSDELMGKIVIDTRGIW